MVKKKPTTVKARGKAASAKGKALMGAMMEAKAGPRRYRNERGFIGAAGGACNTSYTAEKGEKFFAHLSAGSSVRDAARAIKMAPVTMYLRRRTDPEFAARWASAQELQTESLEDEAYVRSAWSDTLLIFMLNARKPDVYRPRSQNTPGVSGEDAARIVREAIDRMEAATSTVTPTT